MQNYKLESGQRGEERQRNKQDKLWGLGRKKPHAQTPSHPQSGSQQIQCVYSGECCFSFCITYVPATANCYFGAF